MKETKMEKVSEKVWAVFGGIALCIALFFIGSSLRTCASKPPVAKKCYPTVLKLEIGSGTQHDCSNGAIALPPDVVQIKTKEYIIVRCVCPEFQSVAGASSVAQ